MGGLQPSHNSRVHKSNLPAYSRLPCFLIFCDRCFKSATPVLVHVQSPPNRLSSTESRIEHLPQSHWHLSYTLMLKWRVYSCFYFYSCVEWRELAWVGLLLWFQSFHLMSAVKSWCFADNSRTYPSWKGNEALKAKQSTTPLNNKHSTGYILKWGRCYEL